MSDTPRTNDFSEDLFNRGSENSITWVCHEALDFARTLERALATVTAERDAAFEALRANRVFHTPIALSRKANREWDEYEIDAINRTRELIGA